MRLYCCLSWIWLNILIRQTDCYNNQLNCVPIYDHPNHGFTCEVIQAVLDINRHDHVTFNDTSAIVEYVVFRYSKLNYLPREIFSYFPNVKMIGMSSSVVDFIDPPKFFNQVQSLEKLRITNSNISHIDKETFQVLNNLKWIRLTNVNLEHLSDDLFTSNSKLEYIDMYYNNIRKIDGTLFKHLKYLKEIDLRKNECVDQRFLIQDGNTEELEQGLCACLGNCVIQDSSDDEVLYAIPSFEESMIVLIFVYLGFTLMLIGLISILYLIIRNCSTNT